MAIQSGFGLLAVRVHYGVHVHLFVSAPPKVHIPYLMRVFKCISLLCFSLKWLTLRGSIGVGILGERGMLLELLAMFWC